MSIGVAIIGAGGIALANHIPGLALHPEARLVALCDNDPVALERAAKATGVKPLYGDCNQCIAHAGVDAVIIATPNNMHAPIALSALAAGKHVLCEKPLALDLATARQVLEAARRAGVRHMTAFTYRFVPAMRYMAHLVRSGAIGRPYHFRAQRFQDWSDRNLGWRQIKALAGTGELGDMLSHRIDYGHLLIGRVDRLVAGLRQFIDMRRGARSELDDWAAIMADYRGGTTGMLESTKLATGRGEIYRGRDAVEINGEAGTIVYSTQKPLEIEIGRRGDSDLHTEAIPREFQVWPGSPRDPSQGDPLVAFRYDQAYEFIDAIVNHRECTPSLREGVMAQAVMEAATISQAQRRWVSMNEMEGYAELWA